MNLTAQATLDRTGVWRVPPGVTRLDGPLYLDSDSRLIGEPGSLLVGDVYVGESRERFSRSTALYDSYLRVNSSGWDLGPPGGGWPSVRQWKFDLVADIPFGRTRTWENVRLAGIQGQSNVPDPQPWVLYWDGGVLTLAVRTTAGLFTYTIPGADAAATTLGITVAIDLDAGVVTAAAVGGPALTVTGGNTLPAGSRFVENYTWPFSVGRLDPLYSSVGAFGTDQGWPEINVTFFAMSVDGDRWRDFLGNPSGTLFTLARKDENHPPVENVVLRDVALAGTLHVGFVEGGLLVDHCQFTGGYRGISSTLRAVAYPITIRDSIFTNHESENLSLYRPGWFTLADSQLRYGRGRAAVLLGAGGAGSASVTNVMVAPPSPDQSAVFEQHGGVVHYDGVVADYETPNGPPLVRLHQETWDVPTFATCARVVDCSAGTGPLLHLLPPVPGYIGPTSYSIIAANPIDARVIVS